jgi:hypothetical protein
VKNAKSPYATIFSTYQKNKKPMVFSIFHKNQETWFKPKKTWFKSRKLGLNQKKPDLNKKNLV